MRRAVLVYPLLSAWLYAQTAAPAAAVPDVFDGVDEAVAKLATITGLAPLKKVQTGIINRAGLKQYLEERIKEEVKPEEIRIEELALKRFGLVPRDFNLKQTTIDLLTEQAAAFYDYHKKKLFMLRDDAASSPVPELMAKEAQGMIVVHELAHALADQHFDLEKFIKRGRTDDSSTARMAVMEGQATWLMLEVMAQKMGQSLEQAPFLVDMMGTGARQQMLTQFPVLGKSPLYIQASLLFPYTGGLKFQQAVFQKLGKAGFSQVFKQAPATTQQILHPEMYFARTEPAKQRLPEVADAKNWTSLVESTVGEFDHAVLLEQYLSKQEAEALAPHWRGGQMALLERKQDKRVALLYVSEWSDAGRARQMFDAYRKVMAGKWKAMKTTAEAESSLSGTSEDGAFHLRLEGSRVVSIEGAEPSAANRK
jgi:hypothetical protein